MNCIKVELHPTLQQKAILTNWFGIFRWYYNRAIDYIEKKEIFDFRKVRNNLRINKKFPIPEWSVNVPPRIITGAIQDCCKAYKTCLSLLNNKKQRHFKMRYKTKKLPNQTLHLEKSCFGVKNHLLKSYMSDRLTGTYYKRDKGNKRVKIKLENIKIEHDCRLIYNGNKYFLYIPIKHQQKQQVSGGVISLDSGIKTFQTCYSINNHCVKIGDNIKDNLKKQLHRQDILRSKMTLSRPALKIKYSRKLKITNLAIRNKIDDLHWKTIKYLTTNYNTILIGDLHIKEILKKMDRGSSRMVNILRHYEFKMRLQYSAQKTGNDVHIVDESYTSKTCGKCGNVDSKLGSNREYNCKKCKISIDRDINGARNILIKNYDKISDCHIMV
jgi:IS605 OrfB family transposase